jgi:hypothetical protein
MEDWKNGEFMAQSYFVFSHHSIIPIFQYSYSWKGEAS